MQVRDCKEERATAAEWRQPLEAKDAQMRKWEYAVSGGVI